MTARTITTLKQLSALPQGCKLTTRFDGHTVEVRYHARGNPYIVRNGLTYRFENYLQVYGPLTVPEGAIFEARHGRPKPPPLQSHIPSFNYQVEHGTITVSKTSHNSWEAHAFYKNGESVFEQVCTTHWQALAYAFAFAWAIK